MRSLLNFVRHLKLYHKDSCTPNMHMNLHIQESVLNYGPVYAFWCFPFERFNGILGTFQGNWNSPELQMLRKFLTYQSLLLSSIPSTLPEELSEFFQLQLGKYGEISISEGSVEESHVDALSLSEYTRSVACPVHLVDATEKEQQTVSKSSEFFNHIEVNWLTSVYKELYPTARFDHIPMVHEHFHEVTVLGERFVSKRVKGKFSAVIAAYWAAVDGNVAQSCSQLRVGVIQNFFRHTISLNADDSAKHKKLTHIFAKVHWYRTHPKENCLVSLLSHPICKWQVLQHLSH